jgi:hypothetical protein
MGFSNFLGEKTLDDKRRKISIADSQRVCVRARRSNIYSEKSQKSQDSRNVWEIVIKLACSKSCMFLLIARDSS